VKRRRLTFHLDRFFWGIIALLVLGFMYDQKCSAFTIALPDIGTAINYDFLAEKPVFEIASAAPAQEVIQSEVTFTQDKHLYVDIGPGSFFHIDLVLRAQEIADLFEPLFISFNESMMLLREDGSTIANAPKNSSIGYYDDYRDKYLFGWDFHDLSEPTIYGFRWSISPDLIPGVELPGALGAEIYMWGPASILVVPEPPYAVAVIAAIIGLVTFRLRSQRVPDAQRANLTGRACKKGGRITSPAA
jgi:hypothetical protein